jgi:D-inositol-3-phosphate glycosyltransferase
MKRTIALISEHASPLASLGGADSGGQNVYVAELARHLTFLNYRVDIFTRWEDPALPQVIAWISDVRIIHVHAGPKQHIAKENIFEYMPAFSEQMIAFIRSEGVEYEIIHANFWMSAIVAADIKRELRIPFVVTFHALGSVRRIYQRSEDKFPPQREDIESKIAAEADHIIAECPQDKDDLIR